MNREGGRRLYRLLLSLAPRRIRNRHADEMEAMFLDALADAHGTRPCGAQRFWTSCVRASTTRCGGVHQFPESQLKGARS